MILRSKDIVKMNAKEMQDKIKELRTELIKSRAAGKKGGKSNIREIKRTVAKLLTQIRANELKQKMETKK